MSSCGCGPVDSPLGTSDCSGWRTPVESGSQVNRPTAGTAPRAGGFGLPGATAAPTLYRSRRRGARSVRRFTCAPGSCSDPPCDHTMTILFREQVPLAPYTTLGLGGPARYFHECTTAAELREALALARQQRLRVQIIGGGRNHRGAGPGSAGGVLQ